MLEPKKRFVLMGLVALAVATWLTVLQPARAASGDDVLVTKASKYSASETLDRLSKILTSKGITVFARVDHAAGAKKVGADLAPTQLLIFGNPKLGTPLMTANRSIAIDLPMKALAWTDKDGKTYLSYTKPSALKSRWGIAERDKIFAKMTGALDKLSNAATGN